MAKKKGSALMEPKELSRPMARFIGAPYASRPEIVKKLWAYIKREGLQDEDDSRIIIADNVLEDLFGESEFDMFEMNRLVSQHIIK